MNTTAGIQNKGQVTIPTHVRRQAGLSKGDSGSLRFSGAESIVTPKLVIDRSQFPNADDEYTAAQRRVIDARLDEADADIKSRPDIGPFETHEEFIASLRKEARKLRPTKTKRSVK